MSKAVNELSARIRRLELAKSRARALARSEILTFRPMQDLLGVSRPTLSGWCDTVPGLEESNSFVRGGNGIEWEFNPRRTVAFLLKHFRAISARQSAKSRAITKAVGVSLADDDEAGSLSEVKERVNLTLTVVRASEQQGMYVLASSLTDFLAGYNQRVLDGIMGVRTKVDPNGNLAPAVRKQIDEYLRSVAAAANAEALAWIGDYSARSEPKGIVRTGRAPIRA